MLMSRSRMVRVLVTCGFSAAMGAAIWAQAAPAAPIAPQGAAQGPAGARAGGAPGGPGGRAGFAPVVIGPPAPVPAVVAIPRPTVDELKQVNDAIAKFVATDKSAAAPLLKKYQSLTVVQMPRANTAATYTQTTQRMGPRHEGFVETAKRGDIDLLLDGDSITDWWLQGEENKA